MTIEQSKDLLKNKGYTSFNLKDLNENYYNKFLPFKCNENNNLKEHMIGLRADYPQFSFQKDTFKSFEETSIEKDKIIQSFIESDLMNDKAFSQIYFQSGFNKIAENVLNKPDIHIEYLDVINNIVKFYFDLDENTKFEHLPFFTYYDTDCVLAKHSDGSGTGRICAILIYLNETYDDTNGGLLILGDDECVVSPVFGNVAIIDLQTFDIKHEVTKVTGGLGRFAILSFVKIKEI
jgi:hypothetical protein